MNDERVWVGSSTVLGKDGSLIEGEEGAGRVLREQCTGKHDTSPAIGPWEVLLCNGTKESLQKKKEAWW